MYRRLVIYPLIALLVSMMCGCGNIMFDDKVNPDCAPHYRVEFRFDKNMKWADAFSVEVNQVTLYVIDEASGTVVWNTTESGERLKADGYAIDLPVAPGRYKLLAWCGDGVSTHFSVPVSDTHTGLQCTMATRAGDDGQKHSEIPLDRLYHGVNEDEEFPALPGVYTYTIYLVKNTNEINVVLQHLSGKPVDSDNFHFSVTDDNSLMDWDNTLIPNGTVTYHAHEVKSGMAGVDISDARTLTQVNACVASLSTARMVKGQDMRLHIHDADGNELVNIPVIDYALLVKGYEAGKIEDQEYLDRQDKYDMVFFLDDQNQWAKTHIYINSWRVVYKETDL